MNRRDFLKITGLTSAGLVTTATMAEAGFFADFAAWIKRRPVWSFPKNPRTLTASDIRNAVDVLASKTYPQGQNAYFSIVHPLTIWDMAADDLLSELAYPFSSKELRAMIPIVPPARKLEINAEFRANGQIAPACDWETAHTHDFRNRIALFAAS